MFSVGSEIDEEVGRLRSGRIFRLGKRRIIARGRVIVRSKEGTTSWCHNLMKSLVMKRRNFILFLKTKKRH